MTLRIEPSQAKVFAGDSVKIDAFVGETTLRPQPPDQSGPDIAPAAPPASNTGGDDLTAPTDSRHDIFKGAIWSVNGVPRGNSSVGVVDAPIIGFYSYEDAAHQPATIWRQTACPVKIR